MYPKSITMFDFNEIEYSIKNWQLCKIFHLNGENLIEHSLQWLLLMNLRLFNSFLYSYSSVQMLKCKILTTLLRVFHGFALTNTKIKFKLLVIDHTLYAQSVTSTAADFSSLQNVKYWLTLIIVWRTLFVWCQ